MADSTVRLVAFVLALVGGLVGLVGAARPLLRAPLAVGSDLDLVLGLLGGVLALVGAVRGWQGTPRDGGVLAIVGGVLLLLAGADLAGILALVGGVLYVVR